MMISSESTSESIQSRVFKGKDSLRFRLAQLAVCPHQQIFSKFYRQTAYVVFRNIRDKNAINQGFWSKTTVFSLPATKMHYLLIFGFHTYNLLQPGSRKQHKYTSIHEYRY